LCKSEEHDVGKIIEYLLVLTVIGLVVSGITYADDSPPTNSSYGEGEVLPQDAFDVHAGQLEIQFIGNAAFHITDGESTLLTDFPYKSGAYGYMQYRMEDIKPIKDGLCLITHPHLDHWDQELFEETEHAIIAPPDILEKIKSDKKIPFDDVMTYQDMVIEAFKTRHDGRPRNFQHYSYLVTWHGLRLYIPGDAVVDNALTMKDIDIMFIPVWLTNKIRSQDLALDAKIRVVFHQKQGQEIPPSQDYVVLKQGETLTVKFKQKVYPDKSASADIIRSAAAAGKLAYRLTTPDELKTLLGPAENETVRYEGRMEILELKYPDIQVIFTRMERYSAPSTLRWINVKGRHLDIGEERQIVLRNEDDLKKLDPFWGLANVSLANLNLRNHLQLLETMPFDSRTKWPGSDKLPDGFDPARLLEDGKNPGLGTRALHKQGIDGRGVGIAIIDQPLLRDHIEYADRIVRYEAINVDGIPVQMHGPPVCSIAVGKTCGVAPGASLYYFAVPMWKRENQPYCDAIDKLIKLNADPNTTERVRVVSISTGRFPQQANFDRWQEALKKAEQNGILVVTCAQDSIQHGMLARIDGKYPDSPNSYQSGIYGVQPGAVLVPASNRTTAGHTGRNVYTFWREAGMSWATPYLAGLAVLAYQVNPEIEPKTIVTLLQKTAVQTSVGAVVQSVDFIKAVRDTQHN